MSQEAAIKILAKQGGKELLKQAITLGVEHALKKIESGDVEAIYNVETDHPDLTALEKSLLRQLLVKDAFDDKEAREAAEDAEFADTVETILRYAAKIGTGILLGVL